MSPQTARRRPRVVGVVLLVLILAIALAGLASLSLDKPGDAPIEITGAQEVQRQLGGIEQKGARLGSPDAPVTIDIFNDMACEDCDDFQLGVVPKLVEDYVRDGDASLVYRHFPMGERRSSVADLGALSAAEQDRQWQWIELFFINQEEAQRTGFTQELLDGIASAVLELDTGQWRRDFDDQADAPEIDADIELAVDLKLPAKPAVVVTGPAGSKELDDAPSLADIDAAIAAVQ